MERLKWLFKRDPTQRRHRYTLFCTDGFPLNPTPRSGEKRSNNTRKRSGDIPYVGKHQTIQFRRFEEKDLDKALGPVAARESVVAYVCGTRTMTDWAVEVLRRSEGMDEKRVLCERWW